VNAAWLSDTELFKGFTPSEIQAALQSLCARSVAYQKGAVILSAGSTTDKMGLVLSGSVTIESNDVWGNRTILSHVDPGQFFAETYALLSTEPLLVGAVANEDAEILFLYLGGITETAGLTNTWTSKLLNNLLIVSAHKNMMLSSRSIHTSPKTIRRKVLAYLNSVALKTNARQFDIPFDRQQLADYLNADRTALSKELGKMKADGLISFDKNHFVIN